MSAFYPSADIRRVSAFGLLPPASSATQRRTRMIMAVDSPER
jgi:hypothetical protein